MNTPLLYYSFSLDKTRTKEQMGKSKRIFIQIYINRHNTKIFYDKQTGFDKTTMALKIIPILLKNSFWNNIAFLNVIAIV